MLLFITICCTYCYSFVLSSSLLISFVYHFVPVLYSTVGSWCIPALQMVCLPSNDIRLLIKYFLSFLPLCSCECSVRISSVTECICPKLHWLPHSPPSQPLATTRLADTILLRLFTTHTLPYINSILGQKALLWILKPCRWDRKVVWKCR
jgi:hypothetical protein